MNVLKVTNPSPSGYFRPSLKVSYDINVHGEYIAQFSIKKKQTVKPTKICISETEDIQSIISFLINLKKEMEDRSEYLLNLK